MQDCNEMISEYREQIIELIYQVYFLKFCKRPEGQPEEIPRLRIFGLSVKQLQEYCTSEKDVIRKINRMPNDDYMMDVTGDGTNKKRGTDAEKSGKNLESTDDIDGFEEDLDDFFDFIMIDKADLEAQMNNRLAKPNNKAKIEKEEETMKMTKGE